MTTSIDVPPIYDVITTDASLSPIWFDWFATFYQTLVGYLTSEGILMPLLSTTARNNLKAPLEGQMIYNSTLKAPQIWQNGGWKTFTTA